MKFQRIRLLRHWVAPIRILIFVGCLAILWLPVYGLSIALISDANILSIVVMAVLLIEFLGLLYGWNRLVYGCDRPWCIYGLQWNRANRESFLKGCGIGLASLVLLFMVQAGLGWIQWKPLSYAAVLTKLGIPIEGLLVGVGVALGEELIFRGWLLDELDRDYAGGVAVWGSSVLFAVLHFIKPLPEIIRTVPQFPGLVLLGLVLAWAKRSHHGHLGIAIGLHAGLVWGYYIVNVGELIQYQHRVSEWWSGIDQNPLAGILGLGFLVILALWFRRRAIVAFRE